MRLSTVLLSLSCLGLLAGCAGRRPDEFSSVDMGLSEPLGANVNLTRLVTGTEFVRNTTLPLLVTVTETPGPTGVSSRQMRINVATPAQGTEYALVGGGTTYIEWVENASGGARVWRSEGGKLTLLQNDAKGSVFLVENVEMNAFSGAATGRFKVNGDVAVRF